jgi:hypothetical protein
MHHLGSGCKLAWQTQCERKSVPFQEKVQRTDLCRTTFICGSTFPEAGIQSRAPEPSRRSVEITLGHSKERWSDLKQVVATLITGHLSRLPVCLEALSGNRSNKEIFAKRVQAFYEQMKARKAVHFVVEARFASPRT